MLQRLQYGEVKFTISDNKGYGESTIALLDTSRPAWFFYTQVVHTSQ